jgi:hypothetical protein
MEAKSFLEQFHDFLAPKLDTYEQAIYLYIFRHGRLLGLSEVTIGFKSARRKIAQGTGTSGSSISEHAVQKKLRGLEQKGCLKVLASERTGTRVRLFLPSEIPGLVPPASSDAPEDIETIDFFEVRDNRALIFERENNECFYCQCKLTEMNRLIEHVVSRPEGNNSYRNVVAACRSCNNKKNALAAEDFLRQLFRQQRLSEAEFDGRLLALKSLRAGELKPSLKSA